MRERLRIAQMRVHVHQADLAAEVRRALRALEEPHRSAVIGHRLVEQAHAVGTAQVRVDQLQMLARLLRRQQIFEDRVDHRERAVPHAGRRVARVQQVTHTAIVEQCISSQHVVDDQHSLKVALHGLGSLLERRCFLRAVDSSQRACEGNERLIVQRHGPGAAHVLAHRRVGRLQGVVPISMSIGGEGCVRHDAFFDQRECALCVLPYRRPGNLLIEQARISRRNQVLRERQHRPERDISMRVAGTDAAVPLEEHEPLRPVAVGVLRAHHSQQQIADRLDPAERQQQLDRTLAHVTSAPAATRVLLQAARR